MSMRRQQLDMPKEKPDGEGRRKGAIRIEQEDVDMFTRYMQEKMKPKQDRLTTEELAKEFGINPRTFSRKIVRVRNAVGELNAIAGNGHKLPEDDDEDEVDPVPSKKQPSEAPKKTPGALSRSVLGRTGGGNDNKSLAVQQPGREEYGVMKMPDKNPLDGLNEGQLSQAGLAVGIVFGGGIAKMGNALMDTDRPLGERAMEMAQGSNAVACGILGIFESLRAFGVFVEEDGRRQPKVIDGVVKEGGDSRGRQH